MFAISNFHYCNLISDFRRSRFEAPAGPSRSVASPAPQKSWRIERNCPRRILTAANRAFLYRRSIAGRSLQSAVRSGPPVHSAFSNAIASRLGPTTLAQDSRSSGCSRPIANALRREKQKLVAENENKIDEFILRLANSFRRARAVWHTFSRVATHRDLTGMGLPGIVARIYRAGRRITRE